MVTGEVSRVDRLLGFLEYDPGNAALLFDAAEAAFEDRQYDVACDLLRRHDEAASPTTASMHLAGLLNLALGQYAEASQSFEKLREAGHDNGVLRFNLAWAAAMQDQWEVVDARLDPDAIAASPRGPALKVQALHHLGRLEEALETGKAMAEHHPDNQLLLGAMATLAMDADEPDLARVYAGMASESAEGLAALGLFALDDHDLDQAHDLFDRALVKQPRNPRAWIGKGLALLGAGDVDEGAEALDQGAEIFSDHLGSWIAAGWAHLIGGSVDRAERSFARAQSLDDTFAESHGGLAVIALLKGDIETGKRESDVALRLDRNSLGGALARIILLERSGDAAAAKALLDRALNAPIGIGGRTLLQSLASLATRH